MSRIVHSFESHDLQTPNLLPPEYEPHTEPNGSNVEPREPRRRSRRGIFSCLLIVIIIIAASCSLMLARANNSFFVGVKSGFLFRQITHLITGARSELAGEDEDRINFLLLGIGGVGHEGPYLSDTIILASFKPSTNEAAMMSIPRDLIVPTGPRTYQKVNHVYALSIKDGLDHAFAETKRVIGETFDQPIHYMGVVDFDGFTKLIDTIGSVTVTVDRSFTDATFPAGPNTYQTVRFTAGTHTMDGAEALTFARSRHGTNGEGSDFARSARQQKVILATKEKVSSFNTLVNPRKITQMYSLVNEYTKTDIEPWEMVKLIQLAKNVDREKIRTIVLDDAAGGFLYGGISSVDGAYILQPRGGSYAALRDLARSMISNNRFASENPQIVVQNGTTIPLLASRVETELKQSGIQPVAIGNAQRRQSLSTRIYDYTNGKKTKTIEFLESRFRTTVQTTIPLEFARPAVASQMGITEEKAASLDFLIIVGEDAFETETNASELLRTLTPEELALRNQTSTPTSTAAEQNTDADQAQ